MWSVRTKTGYMVVLEYFWKIRFGHIVAYYSTGILEVMVLLDGHLIISLDTVGISGYVDAFHYHILRIVIHNELVQNE